MTESLDNMRINTNINTIDNSRALRFQHHCVSGIGGFVGTYTIINHHQILATAQTANMIDIVISIFGGNLFDFIVRLGALVIYLFGFFLTLYVPKHTNINIQTLSLIIDALLVVIIAITPSGLNDVIALYPVFLAMSIQWNSFIKVDGYVSSTIFSTNNLKQATTSLMEYFLNDDKDYKKLDKSKFYGGNILGYHLGVALSFCSCRIFGTAGIWLCFIPIIFSIVSHIRVRKSNQ